MLLNDLKKVSRIGIIGAGWIVRKFYLPYLQSSSSIDEISLFDSNMDQIHLDSNEKLKIATDALSIFTDPEVDLVIIATPNCFHFKYIELGIVHHKHVICEKPICMTHEEGEKIQKLLEEKQSESKIFPALPCRYRTDIEHLKMLLKEEAIGKIYKFHAKWWRTNGIPNSSWFLNKETSGGGVLIDLGSHLIDLMLWLLDFPDPVDVQGALEAVFINDQNKKASWHNKNEAVSLSNVEDNASVMLRFEHFYGLVDLCWAGSYHRDEAVIEFHGKEGYIRLTTLFGFSQETDIIEARLEIYTQGSLKVHKIPISNRLAPYHAMLDAYLQDIGCNLKESVNAEFLKDSLKTIGVIDRLYKLSEGKIINI
ncbi:MAG: Gfo/Idh/MocA family oxidoreductase [Parachlamydiaceae bacterium]